MARKRIKPQDEQLEALSPILRPQNRWQNLEQLATRLGLPPFELDAMYTRYHSGTETTHALERKRDGDNFLFRVRPNYDWVPQAVITTAFGLPSHGAGFAHEWSPGPGIQTFAGWLIARTLHPNTEQYIYAVVDPDYSHAPRTTPAKGPFLRVFEHDHGRRGSIVVFLDHYDNSQYWGYWGPHLDTTRADVEAAARAKLNELRQAQTPPPAPSALNPSQRTRPKRERTLPLAS
jgi:hypothetical protein